MAEQRTRNAQVGGSRPSFGTTFRVCFTLLHGTLAQLVERRLDMAKVDGSSPPGPTNSMPKHMRKNLKKTCGACGKRMPPQKKKFCSSSCHALSRKKAYIASWIAGEVSGSTKYGTSDFVRNYLIQKQKGRCADCKRKTWRKKPITLELEHADGRWKNNSPGNLRMICPNCHSQTPTFKAKNKGHAGGRQWRDQYPRRWVKSQ